ncbi:MAG: lamin tail domain-containing protein, partial [Gaiellaceae bacterium]
MTLVAAVQIVLDGRVGAAVVISQVYGGGGNTGAALQSDFIELFNGGSSAVDISGWSVQYAAASSASWQITTLSGSIAPGHYYLVEEAQGAGGSTALPTPDASGTLNLNASAGKVVLVSNAVTITSTCPTGTSVIDLVGYGSGTNCSEGSGPAPAPSNTTAALRDAAGCSDTNDNTVDFSTAAPTPRNAAASAVVCPTTSGLVVSQVYGGGGNSGATQQFDFIELFNNGSTTVSVSGWSVQYAAATSGTWQATALSGSIAPGRHYLVQEAQGPGGSTSLPAPDAVGTINLN